MIPRHCVSARKAWWEDIDDVICKVYQADHKKESRVDFQKEQSMQPNDKIKASYNQVARDYATERIDELSEKRLDMLLLNEFATLNKHNGPMADLGCGPGQTTKFLYDLGVTNIIGIDLSESMIEEARRISPAIGFETGDMLHLRYDANHFGSAVAFYAIVNFSYEQVKEAFDEVNRVLKPGGQFLFSFHAGDGVIHFDKAHDKDVDLDMYLFQSDKIIKLLHESGFKVQEAIERQPYENVEYTTKRAYIWAVKI